ncbi:MAG: hypothetical protein RL885_01605 [Planctomycetota bacterium]
MSRSHIAISLIGLVAVVAGSTFVLPKIPTKEDWKRGAPPAIAVLAIIENGDRAAIYRLLTQYEHLERIGRSDFWAAVTALGMVDLLSFAEHQQLHESDSIVLENLELAITTLSAMQRIEER